MVWEKRRSQVKVKFARLAIWSLGMGLDMGHFGNGHR